MKKHKICVIGLGYVGLPLANSLSVYHDVIGYDSNKIRIDELKNFYDRTGEISYQDLKNTKLKLISDPDKIKEINIYIITVPTPINDQKQPELTALFEASKLVGEKIKTGSIVVYESTVYPGVTEEECGPIIEMVSGLVCGKDFWLGYSPERINPGDSVHNLSQITKVVSGQNEDITGILSDIYGVINNGKIFKATSIKVAEAAKVIENTQRDINIAFVNEISMIFNNLGLSTLDILETANTKWNFLDFKPGLVGGHCIGVDPFYLAYKAQKIGVNPEIILAGRRINDNMGKFIAERVMQELEVGDKVLILGFTFKENVPDIRNTKVIDIYNALNNFGVEVNISDPKADKNEVKEVYKINLVPLTKEKKYKAIIIAVQHEEYRELSVEDLGTCLISKGLIFDLKGILRRMNNPKKIRILTF
ncbi:MAG: UDP-N-acetyl-D-glucosamine 6-dehydrogenase [Alphaproteobacteria bacterium MarineAlpha2_Bin1]|nr:MAG: UDP-N-acetyl-D-glucosamine 6-dehydrogenase [Alphaproteobacteria bacterium MarineAlpha2_Bin1]